MRILVTYGSRRAGTEGLAQMLGVRLRDEQYDVDVLDTSIRSTPSECTAMYVRH
jgi:menaquinone-dependent protoporphyrinogen IX oxidase